MSNNAPIIAFSRFLACLFTALFWSSLTLASPQSTAFMSPRSGVLPRRHASSNLKCPKDEDCVLRVVPHFSRQYRQPRSCAFFLVYRYISKQPWPVKVWVRSNKTSSSADLPNVSEEALYLSSNTLVVGPPGLPLGQRTLFCLLRHRSQRLRVVKNPSRPI